MKITSFFLEPHLLRVPSLGVTWSVVQFIGLASSLLVVYYLTAAAYSAYFHPLSKYPGPKAAAASFLPLWLHRYNGDYVPWITTLHEQYGSIVRYSPDGISFISAQAWKDIYGHNVRGKKSNLLDPRIYGQYDNGEDDISTIKDDARHGRVRKIFSHAFSDRAIKLQEPLLRGYVDKMVKRLRTMVESNPAAEIDMANLFNRTTFDIMGDLAFGECLDLLGSDKNTPWIAAMAASAKIEAICDIVVAYPLLRNLVEFFKPQSWKKEDEEHYAFSDALMRKRFEKGRDEPDIWNLVLNKGSDILSMNEMHNNAATFMMGGTDTTAGVLSGLTYLLLKNPEKMDKLVSEVRALDQGDLNLAVLPGLSYLNACFEEAMRIYPPAAEGFPRVIPPGGNVIAGEYLPSETRISVPQWTINHSSSNFKSPHSFIPERWLPNSGFDTDVKEAMQPFSVGPRNCIGKNLAYQEMRLIFANVLWNFDMKMSEASEDWLKQKTWLVWERPPLLVQVLAKATA